MSVAVICECGVYCCEKHLYHDSDSDNNLINYLDRCNDNDEERYRYADEEAEFFAKDHLNMISVGDGVPGKSYLFRVNQTLEEIDTNLKDHVM